MQNQAEMERVNRLALGSMRPAIEGRSVYYAVKRGVDIFAAGALLLFFLPLMMVIAAAIYIYSPGPIFFRQERVGARRVRRGGHFYWERVNFPCLKFRTMKVNVDSAIHEQYVKALIQNDQKQMEVIQGGSTPIRKLVNDPRIIRPGRLLRKLSLDELPQFWNVLVGDMSLVGPRPAIPYEVDMYKPWHLGRLEAQPGITGLQQVTARCTADFDEQVRFDLEYINRQSLWLDIQIMLKTPLAVLSGRGAN